MLLVLNLKMNLSKNSILAYNDYIKDKKIIVMPQFPYLLLFRKGEYSLGAQDVSKFSKGSYTGEVCAKCLNQIGVNYCLVGHYERKKYFNETLNDFKKKIQNLNDNDIIPIYCIGETEEEMIEDKEFKSIQNQLEAIPDYTKYIVVTYEPFWLIGKNQTINIDYLNKTIEVIKSYLMERNINHSIIYGGGIDDHNIDIFKNVNGIDGFIISSSALDIDKLDCIYNKINN